MKKYSAGIYHLIIQIRKTMTVFPYILLRIGGGTFENLELVNIEFENTLECLFGKKLYLKNEISKSLYKEISSINDSKKQNILLNLKRSLFNERELSSNRQIEFDKIINADTSKTIREYLLCLKEIDIESQLIIQKYETNILKYREILKILSQDYCLQNGFVFSSQSLLKNVREYINHNNDYTKNIKKTETSIAKYLSRAYAKTSPFSSFNTLGCGKLSDKPNIDFIKKADDMYKIKSNIRLNNTIFSYLKNCIFNIRELYLNFNIALNPTITRQDNIYRYLINFNNVESFQKVTINPIIDYLISLITESGKIKYCDLVKRIINDGQIDASEEAIDTYIYRLIELGFFEFDIEISGLDVSWSEKLITLLSSIGIDSKSKEIILNTLSFISSQIGDFEHAGVDERLAITTQAFLKFKTMKEYFDNKLKIKSESNVSESNNSGKNIEKTETVSNKEKGDKDKDEENKIIKNILYYDYDLKPESIYYEDTVFEGDFEIDDKIIKKFSDELLDLLRYFAPFETNKDEKDIMTYCFLKDYREDEKVDLLTFYEKYIGYKKEKKKKLIEEKERAKLNNRNENSVDDLTNEIPEITKRTELRNKFFEKFISIISEKKYTTEDTVLIEDYDLDIAFKETGLQLDKVKTSLGFFLQFYNETDENNKVKATANSSFPGFGKMTSRFLHLFPESFTDSTRENNFLFMDENNIIAENIDSGIMNFNLHPALMPYEISIPGGNFVLEAEKRILISDLAVKYNKREKHLELFDKKREKVVFTFDLGFQGYGGRSELFKFLSGFSLPSYFYVFPLIYRIFGMFNPKEIIYKGNKDKLTVLPRVSYKDSIIFHRKEWIIPKSLLPFKDYNQKESEYFINVQKWRFELGIPEEVFIKVNMQNSSSDDENKAKKKFSRDDYKPQYINFRNPFLVRLFEKQLDKVSVNLKVTEMLPGSGQMLKVNGKKYVTEFVVQNYIY